MEEESYFPFSVSCSCRSMASSSTRSATVFLLRLTFENACLLSGHSTSLTLSTRFFRKSPSVWGRPDSVISSASIKLAFTAASRCAFASENIAGWCTKPFFNCHFPCCHCHLPLLSIQVPVFVTVFCLIMTSCVIRYRQSLLANETDRF